MSGGSFIFATGKVSGHDLSPSGIYAVSPVVRSTGTRAPRFGTQNLTAVPVGNDEEAMMSRSGGKSDRY